MHRKCDIIAPDRVLLPVVPGAVLGLDQGGVVEKDGGDGVAEEAQDVEDGKGEGGPFGGAPAHVEEGLGVERRGPGQGAGNSSSKALSLSGGKRWTGGWEGALLYPTEETVDTQRGLRGVRRGEAMYRENALRNCTDDGEDVGRGSNLPDSNRYDEGIAR